VNKKLYKTIVLLTAVLTLTMPLDAFALPESHQVGFDTYTYSTRTGSELPLAPAYRALAVVSGEKLGIGNLKNPSDIFVDEEMNRLYIVDTGNNRIVSCKLDFTDSIVYEGAVRSDGSLDRFSGPSGIYMGNDGLLYIADYGNGRILSMEPSGVLSTIFPTPVSITFERDVLYKPQKVAVSKQGDIYVIAEGIFEGILSLDDRGEFQGYVGMNRVQPSAWALFFRPFQ
jgi:sugar lactone lactonase YvrE